MLRSLRLGAILKVTAYAALPLLVVGGIATALIASRVLPGGPTGRPSGLRSALLLGPVGVAVTSNSSARLVSSDGVVSVSVEEGSVSIPIQLRYRQRRPDVSPSQNAVASVSQRDGNAEIYSRMPLTQPGPARLG